MSAAPQKREVGRAGKGARRPPREPVIKDATALGGQRRVVQLNRGVYIVVHAKNGVEQVISNRGWSVYTGPAAGASDEAIEDNDDYEGAVPDDDDDAARPGDLPLDDESAHETDTEKPEYDSDDDSTAAE